MTPPRITTTTSSSSSRGRALSPLSIMMHYSSCLLVSVLLVSTSGHATFLGVAVADASTSTSSTNNSNNNNNRRFWNRNLSLQQSKSTSRSRNSNKAPLLSRFRISKLDTKQVNNQRRGIFRRLRRQNNEESSQRLTTVNDNDNNPYCQLHSQQHPQQQQQPQPQQLLEEETLVGSVFEDVSRGGASSNGNININANGNHAPSGSPSTRATSSSTELLEVESEESPASASLSDSEYDVASDSDSDASGSGSSDTEEEETIIIQQEELEEFTIKASLKTLKEKRRQFLDHIALISSSFLKKEHPASLLATDENEHTSVMEHHAHNDNVITPQTDLSLPGRHFHVVTTAALPWMTGTAVNPLLRAAYLHRRTQQINSQVNVDMSVVLENGEDHSTYVTSMMDNHYHNHNHNNVTKTLTNSQFPNEHNNNMNNHKRWVTLVIPWLELEEDQLELYGQVFDSPQAQEYYIRNWLANDADMPDAADPETGLKLLFYNARYHSGLRSIFAMGDICQLISDSGDDSTVMDVCVLEEPEHCNWYRAPGDGWTQKFHYVVGIVHTNYKEYASAHYSGLWTAPAIALISSAMVRAYCHQVIKLSDVLQTFAPEKEATSNVHGVRSDFLNVGLARAKQIMQQQGHDSDNDGDETDDNDSTNATPVYFIGKLLWAKGLDLLLELQDYYKQCTGHYFPIDIYGSGPEQKAIRRAYWGRKLISKNRRMNATVVNNNNATASSSDNHVENATSSTLSDHDDASQKHRHHHHRYRHYRRSHNKHKHLSATKIFTSKDAFKEHLRKIKESLPSTAEQWRNFKESITSAEMPTTFHEWRRSPIPATFPGRIDHASLGKHATNYKVFVNPSVSEVLCTTTAEALAMGKFAIIPVHPSNAFFLKFPNCLAYRNKFEFAANLQWALTHKPEPLTPELAHEFTWEAATDRFIQASAVTWKEAREREALGLSKRDERIAWFLKELGKGQKGDILRKFLGGGPVSHQVKYVMEQQSKLEEAGGDIDEDDDDDQTVSDADDEDEGLTKKFQQSSFVQALRATLSNGVPSTIARNSRER